MPVTTVAVSVGGKEIPKKSTRDFKSVPITKEGNKILIPDGMSYAEARTWLSRQEEAEEKTVNFRDELSCYPLDGIIAMMYALRDRYGFAELQDTPGFFGPQPPLLVQVELADGTFETAPLGRIATPKWEGGHMDLGVGREAKLVISGTVKRKNEAEIKEIITHARESLKENSIYKGQAITVDLAWMDEGNFHPMNNAPKFMKVKDLDEGG
jgi:transitional endoplasmic reticulum ATPase